MEGHTPALFALNDAILATSFVLKPVMTVFSSACEAVDCASICSKTALISRAKQGAEAAHEGRAIDGRDIDKEKVPGACDAVKCQLPRRGEMNGGTYYCVWQEQTTLDTLALGRMKMHARAFAPTQNRRPRVCQRIWRSYRCEQSRSADSGRDSRRTITTVPKAVSDIVDA